MSARFLALPALAALLLAAAAPSALAAGKDLAEGKRLLAEHGCNACHEKQVPGGPGAIYTRKDRKVTSLPKLQAQVAQCNSSMGLGLFPEDEQAIVAYLDATYYKFK